MNKVDWYEDRHLCGGLMHIRFEHDLSKEVKRFEQWKDSRLSNVGKNGERRKLPASHYEIPDDSTMVHTNNGCDFYKLIQQYRLSLFLYDQLNRLKDAINLTCERFYDTANIPAESRLPGLATVNEAMAVYYEYENEKFFLELDGGGFNIHTRPLQLDQSWLIAQIFGSQDPSDSAYATAENSTLKTVANEKIAEKVRLIKLLECVKIGHILFDYVEETTWTVRLDEKLIAKLHTLSDSDGSPKRSTSLRTFCFYLVLAYNGMLNLSYDKYATLINATQAWRLSPELEFSIQATQVLNVTKVSSLIDKSLFRATMVAAHVLPYRQFETKHETPEVNAISKKQYILLTDIFSLQKPKEEARRKAWAKGKHEVEWSTGMQWMCKWFEVYEYLKIDSLREYKLGVLEVFKKNNVNRANPAMFMKENVNVIAITVGREKTYQLQKDVFADFNLLECDKKNFEFDAYKRTWRLRADCDMRDTITQIYKAINLNDMQWQADKQIVAELSSEKNVDKLLSIIKQIPNLDIQLSTLQQAVITSSENLLCLGRSGTGKTTSSVLRLFAQEIMYMSFKKLQKLQRTEALRKNVAKAYSEEEKKAADIEEQKRRQFNVRLRSSDFLKPTYMKTVFISASPVLVNEVNRFYTQLRDSIISHLKKKEAEKPEDNELKSESTSVMTDEQVLEQQQEDLLKVLRIEADALEQEMASQQQMNIPAAYEDLKPQHFPLFLTVKQLLFMLDASLYDSFFFRDSQNKVVGMENNLTWHNENKGLFMINQQYKTDTDYDKLLLEFTNEVINDVDAEDLTKEINTNEQQTTEDVPHRSQRSGGWRYKRQGAQNWTTGKMCWQRQQLSFEIDYDVFVTRFFNRFKQKSRTLQRQKKLSEALIWTEIFSVIKGGTESSKYYGGILPAKQYIMEFGSPTLTRHELQTVYWIFIEYEKWKDEQNAFDLMDLVIHLRKSNKVSSSWYQELRMDYLMIDEVQDLTPATLDLFIRLTRNKVFFAGDTAQTIAKGVGARFSDLQQLFKQLNISVIQLTTNYRSHGKILALANSVVNIIETLFPFSIDKLKKEESETDGLRPILLTALKPHELKRFFLGTSRITDGSLPTAFAGNKPQFGCSQVLIVRDQAMKSQIPDFLQSMLCLTVYEAKGLEFDDVFLYNFFSGDNIDASHWKLLNEIGIIESIQENAGDDEIFTKIDKFCSQAIEEENKVVSSYVNKHYKRIENDVKREQKMISKSTQNRALIYRKYSLLCIELKFLYVAITRPRKRLIIYDDKVKVRQPIQRVWEALGIIDVVNSHMIENGHLPPEISEIFKNGYASEELSSQSEWKLQGVKFFKKKCYDQAIKCFRFAEEPDLVIRCEAYQAADAATSSIADVESNQWRIKNSQTINKNEKRVIQKQNKVLRMQAKAMFKTAGESFEQCGLFVQAASCYFSAKAFERAGAVFEKLKQYAQAGECLMQLNTSDAMLRAAEMFQKGKLITRAIECYEQLGAWEQLLHCLHQNSGCFREDERQRLANRYIPIALNKLYLLLTNEEPELSALEKNKGAIQELKIKRKFENNQDKIEEEDEEEDVSSSSEEYNEDQSQVDESVVESVNSKSIKSEIQTAPKPLGTFKVNLESTNSQTNKVTIQVNLAPLTSSQPAAIQEENEKESKHQALPIAVAIDAGDSRDDMERLSEISYELVDEDNLEEEQIDVFEEVFQLNKKKSSALEKKKSQMKAQAQTETTAPIIEQTDQEEEKEQVKEQEAAGDGASFEVINDGQSIQSSEQLSQQSFKLEGKQGEGKSEFEELAMSNADFDHLSQYDPDDEFLQNAHSISILESILNSKLNQSSDFSVIEGDGDDVSILSLNSSVKGSENMRFLAKHQKIEDKIVQKIIYYISLFSSEVKEKLDQLHIGKTKKQAINLNFKEEEEIKLDKVPTEFLEVVLSILEHYELIRLGLIICNKFKMNHHIGKYIVQSCIKYSNLHLYRYNFFQVRATSFQEMLQFKQRQASIIAHEAMHNVLGLVAPKYLTLKKFNEPLTDQNSLGLNNYKLMLQLGFWKKIVYATNGRTALSLCFRFNDLDNYNFIAAKMIESNEESSEHRITQEQQNQIAIMKVILIYKCSLALIYKQTHVWNASSNIIDTDTLEKKFALIEMQLQDNFATFDEAMNPLVTDLVTIAKYMLQKLIQPKKAKAQAVNRIHDKTKQAESLKSDEYRQKAFCEASRQAVEELLKEKFIVEPKNDEQFVAQCCVAFYLVSFSSIHNQLESLQGTEPSFNKKFVSKLQYLLSFVDPKNLRTKAKFRRDKLARKVFFASFNLDALDRDDFTMEESENLFAEFQEKYYLLSTSSQLTEKLQDIHQKLLSTTILQGVHKLFHESAQKYFYQCTQLDKLNKQIKLLEMNPFVDQKMEQQFDGKPLALIFDLDLQFVMVPHAWTDILLEKKMTKVHDVLHQINVANITKSIKHEDTTEQEQIRLACYKFNTTMQSAKLWFRRDQDRYFKLLLSSIMHEYRVLQSTQDEVSLLSKQKWYQSLANMRQSLEKATDLQMFERLRKDGNGKASKILPIGYIDVFRNYFDNLLFSTGFFQTNQLATMQKSLRNDYMLLETGMHLFANKNWFGDKTFGGLSDFFNYQNAVLTLGDMHPVYVDCLRILVKQNKVTMATTKNPTEGQQVASIVAKAALKASQINQYIVNGAISMASQQIMVFYRQVQNLFTYSSQAVAVLEKAFYPVLVGMLGKAYISKAACSVFDWIDVYPLLAAAYEKDPDCDEYYEQNEDGDIDLNEPYKVYTEWDRMSIEEVKTSQAERKAQAQENAERLLPIIVYKAKGMELEAVKQDQTEVLVEILRKTNDLLVSMNQDSFNTNVAKQCFNLLMTAAVNLKLVQFDSKKQVSAHLLKQGFKLLAKCNISDYFENISFQYFDIYSESEIMGLKQMFAETEDNSKYQFFAFQKLLVQVDVTECQQKSKQTNNQNIFLATLKAQNAELRILAKRERAKQILRKYIRKLKSTKQFKPTTMKTINCLRDEGLTIDLTGIDQSVFSVSGIENDLATTVRYLDKHKRAIETLRALVLSRSKYLTSSYDIQSFYKAQDKLSTLRADLLAYAQEIVETKLYPLREYQHLELSSVKQSSQSLNERFEKELKIVQTFIALWHLRSKALREHKEIEQLEEKSKRLNIKWNSWNELAKKRVRLQNKIKQLQQ